MINFALLLLLSVAPLAQSQSRPATTPPAAAATATVPTWTNATCPVMGKQASMSLFVDTDLGRIYVCCKPCYKKVLADLPTAHRTAYPVVKDLANATCPVSGEAIGGHAVSVTLQGYRFRVCCPACVPTTRGDSQPTLAKLTAAVTDLGNATCPITGEPVAANAFVAIGSSLVRLSSARLAAQVAKDPEAALTKARAIVQGQPARQKHEHSPAPKQDQEKAQ